MLLFAAGMEVKSRTKRKADRHINENWISETSSGNMDAMEKLYNATKSDVYGFALSILRNPQSAQDVMQDTYLQIYNSGSQYRAQGKPMAWILTIVRNLSLMKLRDRSGSHLQIEEQWELSDSGDTAGQVSDRLLLQSAMEILNDEERQIIILHSVSGMKHREIADLLDIPLSTILSKYSRALAKLKKRLEGYEI